jgi:hypothetical protein
MANTSWKVGGEYFETCSCDYLCPCIATNLAGQPTKGSCTVAMAFHVDQGSYGDTDLHGLNFAVVAYTPGPMGDGNWSVGVITDERANAEQQQALVTIASGQGGGPMATLGPLVGKFLGAESKPIQFHKNGMTASVSIPGVLEQSRWRKQRAAICTSSAWIGTIPAARTTVISRLSSGSRIRRVRQVVAPPDRPMIAHRTPA